MRNYTQLDMIRMGKFAKNNPELKPIELLKAYNLEHPEKSEEEKKSNLLNAVNRLRCDCSDDLQIFGCEAGDHCIHFNY